MSINLESRLTNNLFSTADYASKMEEIYKKMFKGEHFVFPINYFTVIYHGKISDW